MPQPSTYSAFSDGSADETPQGRFTKQFPGTQVASTPNPYPKQPPNSPWAGDAVPNEGDPLGYEIDFVEACGTPAEVQASIEELADRANRSIHEVAPPSESRLSESRSAIQSDDLTKTEDDLSCL